ncbi:MAG: cupin domain-containing protein [candidate division Zixibacteria bacterium]|nr:cupin domain-containing protein [candidate division Zixibacteria bacterium]
MEHHKKQKGIEELGTKAKSLVDLIDYQDDSVVSREIINKKTGTITAFAFDEGQGLSEHTAPFDAVVQILDGEAQLTIGGEVLSAFTGQMVIMPANVPHSVKATKKFKMLLTMIRS